MTRIPGRATPEGTARYRERSTHLTHPRHFRTTARGLHLSSLGVGTYLGSPDEETDQGYEQSLQTALAGGINVVDTAVNYRHMRSERAVGRALAAAVERGTVARDEVFVATKGGFMAFDATLPVDPPRWFHETWIASGILQSGDLVNGSHALTPAWLDHHLERSLENLGLETIDLYFLHNPEVQRTAVEPEEYRERLRRAFTWCEQQVASGRIAAWGLATWQAFRVRPDNRLHLDLTEMLGLAREAGGEGHHFTAIQLPLNLSMPEALTRRTQRHENGLATFLDSAFWANLDVFTSASIMQGQLPETLPMPFAGVLGYLETPAQQALQFSRSAPGVTSALVGMSRPEHVTENLHLVKVPPMSEEAFREAFLARSA
jgi:aryl-alcohol dehydrogenase-like predicted oxidoreductase